MMCEKTSDEGGKEGVPISLMVVSSSIETHFLRGMRGGLEVLGIPETW